MKTLYTLIIILFFSSLVSADWTKLSGYPVTGVRDIKQKNGILYAGGVGLYASSNNGANWTQRMSGLDNPQAKNVFAIESLTSGLFIATMDGVYKSTDEGLNWIKKSEGLQIGPQAVYIYAQSIFEDSGNIYTGTFNAIYKSTNNGENWTPVTPIEAHMYICSFNRYGSYIIAGTSIGNRYPVTSSSNNGANWSITVIPTHYGGGAFCIYTEPGKIFLGTGAGMYYSTNNGANWVNRSAGLGADPYIFDMKKVGNTLFASTNDWVFKTTNEGLNWSLIPFSGQTFQDVNKILIYNNKIYVAAAQGIWYHELDSLVTGIENPAGEIPSEFKLSQNYPNPFNPSTKIEYQIPSQSNVLIKVYDFLGKEVQVLVNEIKSAGSYSLDFNASALSSGVYFYKLETDNFTSIKKMTVIK